MNALRDKSEIVLRSCQLFDIQVVSLSAGVVSKPKGKVEEKGALWTNAASSDAFLNRL